MGKKVGENPVEAPKWSTLDEVKFIEGIGSFSDLGESVTRKKLLQGYLTACKWRGNWGDIDRDKVMQAVEKEME